MAPTTLLGQVTTTSPYGRDKDREGYPIRIAEILAPFEGGICGPVAIIRRLTQPVPKGPLKGL